MPEDAAGMSQTNIINCEITPQDNVLSPATAQVQQILSVDIMFVKKVTFAIGVLSPLGLTLVKHIRDRATGVIMDSLRSFVSTARSRNFEVKIIKSDGEGGVDKCRGTIEEMGILLDVAGPGQHVSVVERKIQTIKERVRMYDSGMPYVMTKLLLIMCVYFCVSKMNMHPGKIMSDTTAPYEQFTGRKLNAKTDLRINFGDYVQATEAYGEYDDHADQRMHCRLSDRQHYWKRKDVVPEHE
jgi:hypothetical protein